MGWENVKGDCSYTEGLKRGCAQVNSSKCAGVWG